MAFIGKQHFAWPKIGRNIAWPTFGSAAIDADVTTFMSDTYADIVDDTIEGALNGLVTSLKAQGLWSKCYAIYPLVSDGVGQARYLQHKYNLKNPAVNLFPYLGTHPSIVHNANGVSGSLTGSFVTAFNQDDVHAQKVHAGFYNNTTNNNANHGDLWQADGDDFVLRGLSTNRYQFKLDASGVNLVTASVSDWSGFIIGSITDSKIFYQMKGVTIDDDTSFVLGNLSTQPFEIMASTESHDHRFYTFGTELTEAECATYNTIMETFQTALSRNV